MAVPLLLRGGRIPALKAVFLEARVFRELSSTVLLSTESKKSEGGIQSSPKEQSAPKDVVGAERGKLLATHTAAALSKSTSPPSSYTAVESTDSDSDGEGHDSNIDPQVASKGKAGLYKPEASGPRAPKITVPAKEKAKVQKPRTDVTYPERSQQPKKKGAVTKPVEDSKETRSKPMTSRSQSSGMLGTNSKEELPQGKPRPSKTRKESPKPFEAEGILPIHPSARLTGGPVPTPRTTEASAGEQLPAATSRAKARHPEPKEPEPEWKAAAPQVLVGKENLEKQVPEGCSKAKGETLEDQKPVRYSKTVPVEKQDTLEERAGPQLEGRFQEAVGEAPPTDAGPPQEAPDDTQEHKLAPEWTVITTYKNLQHHGYNTYTFLDLNLDLSKFRMPQPSSGRESPRH
ncbi:NADHubiquinone oxidoreductase core subunit V3 [Cricetulus griseus]